VKEEIQADFVNTDEEEEDEEAMIVNSGSKFKRLRSDSLKCVNSKVNQPKNLNGTERELTELLRDISSSVNKTRAGQGDHKRQPSQISNKDDKENSSL
jgi:hypothetical protein